MKHIYKVIYIVIVEHKLRPEIPWGALEAEKFLSKSVSQEGYNKWEDAKEFIEKRSDEPKRSGCSWCWYSKSNRYSIKEITIKENN